MIKVLIADDQELIRQSLQIVLNSKPDITVCDVAEDGQAVIRSVRKEKPDIILIMTDQQRGDALGCAGNGSIITPHLDLLAADGYLFTNAYSSAPSSTPARAGLLTGLTPWHHGTYEQDLSYSEQRLHSFLWSLQCVDRLFYPLP